MPPTMPAEECRTRLGMTVCFLAAWASDMLASLRCQFRISTQAGQACETKQPQGYSPLCTYALRGAKAPLFQFPRSTFSTPDSPVPSLTVMTLLRTHIWRPLLQVCQFAEGLEAGINFVASQRSQALGPEALDYKRAHDAAVEHGTLQDLAIDFRLRSQVTHESSSEGIAGAGRVFHFVDGQGRGAEWVTSESESTFAEEDCRTVFSVLDHERLRPHGHHFLSGAGKVRFVGQHLSLGVIDEQDVD